MNSNAEELAIIAISASTEVSVTLGAYMLAANVVGLSVALTASGAIDDGHSEDVIPVRIILAVYPQLKQLA